jgi:hypothetical protein
MGDLPGFIHGSPSTMLKIWATAIRRQFDVQNAVGLHGRGDDVPALRSTICVLSDSLAEARASQTSLIAAVNNLTVKVCSLAYFSPDPYTFA